MSETLRQAVSDCGQSLAQVARQTGIDVGNLSRFVRGERGLSVENLDELQNYLHADCLHLQLQTSGLGTVVKVKVDTADNEALYILQEVKAGRQVAQVALEDGIQRMVWDARGPIPGLPQFVELRLVGGGPSKQFNGIYEIYKRKKDAKGGFGEYMLRKYQG